jgi:hypothetical protein
LSPLMPKVAKFLKGKLTAGAVIINWNVIWIPQKIKKAAFCKTAFYE